MEGKNRVSTGNKKPRVAIIGAGAAGMIMAIRLQKAGYNDFVIYEKGEDVGGTWRENRYPGVACDVPAHHYAFTFEPNPGWHSRLAGGAEIQSYMKSVAEKYGLRPHIVFGQKITSAKFDGSRWHINTDKGLVDQADFLVAATGPLHVPLIPDFKGLDQFEGKCFHSSDWPEGLDPATLKGKRVGVIGNGSSGVQIVSSLAKLGADVTVFMRTPQWVFPLGNRYFGAAERALVKTFPWIGRMAGGFFKWFFEHVFAEAVIHDGWQRKFLSSQCRRNLASIKDPELKRKLAPPDKPMCRRMVMSADFYPALQKSNTHLVQEAIDRVESKGVVTKDGKLHEFDVLVLATGFWTRAYGRPLELINEQGKTLTEAWKDKVGAHLSIHVPGFPNYLILGGPHSPRGNFSAIAYSEAIVDHIMNCIELAARKGLRSITARPEAMVAFQESIDARLKGTIWITGCKSWYLDENGKPENWTGTPGEFRDLMRAELKMSEFEVA
jgi:cation diffusion facilitator CzcD-associated flavoprotein CzcO